MRSRFSQANQREIVVTKAHFNRSRRKFFSGEWTALGFLRNEVQLYAGTLPASTSVCLAAHLVGNLTSASQAAQRGEIQMRIQDSLNSMEPMDREVLALRHFEMLTNEETAVVLGLKKAAASNRYVRALKRLKLILDEYPELL